MFENLERLSQRVQELAEALIRETPPGQEFNTHSPTYQQLHATLLETQEHAKQLEAQAVEQFHKDIADLPPIPEPAAPAPVGVSIPAPEPLAEEQPEGTVTFQFERNHVPAEEVIRTELAKLAALVHPEKQPSARTTQEAEKLADG